MKNLPALIVILLVVSCEPKEQINMTGAYSMTSQVINDGTKDSIIDRKQLKIYTDKYMVYASPNVTDSFANFGIGTYTVKDDKLTEYRFYSAENGEKTDTFVLTIDKNVDGYRQIIDNLPQDGRMYKLTEDYENASTDLKSPLDGAWRQVRNVYIRQKGDSSVNNNPLEYKAYQSGYFIWGITVKDSLNKPTSVFGYGPFKMQGDKKVIETIVNSTFTSNLGKSYEVDIEFTGKDTYKQTITFANGDKSIEVYERLK